MTRGKLMDKVEVTKTCWNWLGEITTSGYGRIWEKKNLPAHRVSYELFVGKIPEGLQIDHLCRNRRCVNPTHLEPVTAGENVRRAWRHRIENTPPFCKRGHPRSGKFLYWVYEKKTGKRWRSCKKCRAEANLKWLAKKEKETAYL